MTTSNITAATILCIPGVFANIGEDRIRRAFTDLDIGEVVRVDIVTPKPLADAQESNNKSNKKFNRVFVHIIWNEESKQATAALAKLQQPGKEIKIVYDEPWFWKVSLYKKKEKKPVVPVVFKPRKAILQIDDDDEEEHERDMEKFKSSITQFADPASAILTKEKEKEPDLVMAVPTATTCQRCGEFGHSETFCPETPFKPDYGSAAAPKRKGKGKVVVADEAKKNP
jgi:hypothetical protein